MSEARLENQDLKAVFKEALVEALHEEREFLHGVFSEVLEDIALAEAIRQGRENGHVSRGEVMGMLDEAQA